MAVLTGGAIRAALLIGALIAPPAAFADAVDEHALMAVYIYNFAKFTQWPAASFTARDAPLNLCVLGEDPLAVALDTVKDKKAQSRPLAIIRYPRVALVSHCHILFISRSERHRLALILQTVGRLPILTVSDIQDFSDRGGMITLQVDERRLRFAINLESATRAGLQLSSKLLELAAAIKGGG